MFERIYFILAPSFHGATLLSKLLNAHPEITALGDTLPTNRFDQICGCGTRVSACSYWRAVKADLNNANAIGNNTNRTLSRRCLLELYPGENGGYLGRLAYSDFLSFWATPTTLRRLHSGHALLQFRNEFDAFVASIHRRTPGAGHVFVDGTKYISRVEALTAAGLPVDGVIHLARDPVDFVCASIRNTGRGGPLGVMEHALRYRLYHTLARQAASHAKASLKLSYEELAENTDIVLGKLFRFLRVDPLTVAQLRPFFSKEWHFMGNSSLFSFDGTIRRRRHDVSSMCQILIRTMAGT